MSDARELQNQYDLLETLIVAFSPVISLTNEVFAAVEQQVAHPAGRFVRETNESPIISKEAEELIVLKGITIPLEVCQRIGKAFFEFKESEMGQVLVEKILSEDRGTTH